VREAKAHPGLYRRGRRRRRREEEVVFFKFLPCQFYRIKVAGPQNHCMIVDTEYFVDLAYFISRLWLFNEVTQGSTCGRDRSYVSCFYTWFPGGLLCTGHCAYQLHCWTTVWERFGVWPNGESCPFVGGNLHSYSLLCTPTGLLVENRPPNQGER
jgi:hypothetical protein